MRTRKSGRIRSRTTLYLGTMILSCTTAAFAQPTGKSVYRLTTGGGVAGDLARVGPDRLIIDTAAGEIALDRRWVVRVEPEPRLLSEYTRRSVRAESTVEAQVDIASWCFEHGLFDQARDHLLRAQQLEPDATSVRERLNQTRVGLLWVDGRAAPSGVAAPSFPAVVEPGSTDERLLRAIQLQWQTDLKLLVADAYGRGERMARSEARQALAEVDDPLAFPAVFRQLTRDQRPEVREQLVGVLHGYAFREATEALTVAAIEDEDAAVRAQALEFLTARPRGDVIELARAALATREPRITAGAARVLVRLEALEAVDALIDALSYPGRRVFEEPIRGYDFFGEFVERKNPAPVRRVRSGVSLGNFSSGRTVGIPDQFFAQRYNYYLSSSLPTTELVERDAEVTNRDVRDALVELTGEDFGFDKAAWYEWAAGNLPAIVRPSRTAGREAGE